MKKFNFKEWINKNTYYLITGICGITIIIALYILNEVAPFGENSMLTVDFYHQYGPMLGELYDRVKNFDNLFYSFNMGMGLPFFRNFYNYMSSLFNIIIFLVKRENLLTSYSVIIGLKPIVSAVCMNIFLNYKFKNKSYINIPLSLMYAFNNYFVAYYWNIMWVDGLVFLPIIALGIEKLINDDNIYVYIFGLALMLFSNYFIGYMMCIFSVLYFIAYLFIISDKKNIKTYINKSLKFMICSLIAGGICAFALMPMFKSLTGISATSDVWPSSQYYGFTLIEFIYNHLSGVSTTVFKSDAINAPNITCGIVVIPLLILFLLNNKIKLRTKLGYMFLIGIMIFSFFNVSLDFIWHAFHVPNDLPYRYSFIYPFILTIIGGYALNNIKSVKEVIVIVVFVLSLIFVSSVYFISGFDISDKIIIVNLIILILWFMMYVIYKYFEDKRKIIPLISIFTVVLEVIICVNNNWDITQNLKSFYEDYETIQNNLDYIKNKDDSLFYRVERSDMHTFNDSSWYNYYGINAFSSMEYENLAVLQNKLGMPGNYINSFYYTDNSPIYNVIFNLKYVIGNIDSNNYYDLFFSDIFNSNYMHKSKMNSNLMYIVNKDIKKWDFLGDNPFEIQNDFINKSFGKIDVLENVKINNDSIVKYDNGVVHKLDLNNSDGYIYISDNINSIIIDNRLYIRDENNVFIDESFDYFTSISLNESKVIHYSGINSIYVAFNNEFANNLNIYFVNENKLKELNNTLVDNMVYINEFNENKIKAYVNCNEGTIFTSIPYDEGWIVYVDGKKVDTFEIGNALLGFDVLEGEHNIILKYKIPYFKIGSIISICSLGCVVIYYFVKKKKLIVN